LRTPPNKITRCGCRAETPEAYDNAFQGNAAGLQIKPTTLHRLLNRHLLIDDSVVEVYRAFVDRPG
jgi:hypothetical protein